MSTRACYTFKDEHKTFHVYKHSDGYPSGAEKWIRDASHLAWGMPRFEASNFGAAFIAANMRRAECRLMDSGDIKAVAPCDIAYRYEVEMQDGGIWITAFRTSYFREPTEEQLWRGHIDSMADWIESSQQS